MSRTALLVRLLCIYTFYSVGGGIHSHASTAASGLAERDIVLNERVLSSSATLDQRKLTQELQDVISAKCQKVSSVMLRDIDDIWNDLQREELKKQKASRALKAKL